MINSIKLWAKALFSLSFNNPGLKPGVIDNERFMDFSPEFGNKLFTIKPFIVNKLQVKLTLI